MVNHGTLTEEKVPDPRYALPSTVHWMRGLAILVEDEKVSYARADSFFGHVARSEMPPQQENSVFEHLLLAVHQLAALRALETVAVPADIVRVACVAWYYGIYAAATAMIAAQDGTVQDSHGKTANAWDRQLVQRRWILHPFDLRVSTLVEKDAQAEIDRVRRSPKANLVAAPATVEDAHRSLCGYLSGTADRMAWTIREKLKDSPEFKKLGVADYRTKRARTLRDARLSRQPASFLHQAIRFRGKANYREALYLAHGSHVGPTIAGFVADMAAVLEAFLAMAGAFAFRRLGEHLKRDFIEDLDANRSFSLDHRKVWS